MKRPIIIITIIIFLISIWYSNNKYKVFYNKVKQEIEMVAVVISNEKENNYYKTYTIKGKSGIYTNKKFILNTNKNLEYGNRIKLKGNFSEPSEERNYKGFNYKKYLKSNKIYGIINANNIEVVAKNNINILLTLSNNLRNKIIKNIQKILPNEASGLLIGLILGDKTKIEEDIINNFEKSGLAHVLAVSGTHVSYIILGLTFLVTYSKIPKRYGYLFIIFLLIMFLFLTSFTPSVVRACVMAIIIVFAKLFYRKADIINTLFIALLIAILNNPFSINSLSLELSYLGVIGVVFISPIIKDLFLKIKVNEKLAKILSVPIAAQIAILPILIISFNTVSLTFLISNIVAIPLLRNCNYRWIYSCIYIFYMDVAG